MKICADSFDFRDILTMIEQQVPKTRFADISEDEIGNIRSEKKISRDKKTDNLGSCHILR